MKESTEMGLYYVKKPAQQGDSTDVNIVQWTTLELIKQKKKDKLV